MCSNELANRLFVFFFLVGLQISNQAFTTHILHYFLWSVESALILIVLQQIFKDATKHFGVDPHFSIIRVVFVDGKVILGEHCQQILKIIGRETNRLLIKIVSLKQSSIEIRNAMVAEAFNFGVIKVAPIRTVTVQAFRKKIF